MSWLRRRCQAVPAEIDAEFEPVGPAIPRDVIEPLVYLMNLEIRHRTGLTEPGVTDGAAQGEARKSEQAIVRWYAVNTVFCRQLDIGISVSSRLSTFCRMKP